MEFSLKMNFFSKQKEKLCNIDDLVVFKHLSTKATNELVTNTVKCVLVAGLKNYRHKR